MRLVLMYDYSRDVDGLRDAFLARVSGTVNPDNVKINLGFL